MAQHISVRVPWHDHGWDGTVCQNPCDNNSCLRLTNISEKLGYHSQIILNGRQVNDSMGAYVADAAIKEMIEAEMAPKKATVIILGLTFKENCPDTRNSKVVDIINRLKEPLHRKYRCKGFFRQKG